MVWLRRAHLVAAWAFTAGVVIQVFLAGLGVFESSSRFGTHAGWGFLLGFATLALLALAAIGGGRRQVQYAAALLGLFFVQSMLVGFRDSAPTVAALHPLNGFLILFVSVAMSREAWRNRDREIEATASPQPAGGSAGG